MSAHLQLAIILAGALSCIVHLFGGLFFSQTELFYAGPIALLAMLPVAARPRTQTSTLVVWVLAVTFFASFFDEQKQFSSNTDLLEVLEWAMLLVVLRAFHRRPVLLAS